MVGTIMIIIHGGESEGHLPEVMHSFWQNQDEPRQPDCRIYAFSNNHALVPLLHLVKSILIQSSVRALMLSGSLLRSPSLN